MSTTLSQLLEEHASNCTYNTGYKSQTNKSWAKQFSPYLRLQLHTHTVDLGDGSYAVAADFGGSFLPEDNDDLLRRSQPTFPPNLRSWRLEQEEDCVTWFHAEVSSIVLSGFSNSPLVLQHSQPKPFTDDKQDESVDVAYTLKHQKERTPLVIGELKRNLINAAEWSTGMVRAPGQQALARELRG